MNCPSIFGRPPCNGCRTPICEVPVSRLHVFFFPLSVYIFGRSQCNSCRISVCQLPTPVYICYVPKFCPSTSDVRHAAAGELPFARSWLSLSVFFLSPFCPSSVAIVSAHFRRLYVRCAGAVAFLWHSLFTKTKNMRTQESSFEFGYLLTSICKVRQSFDNFI